MERELLNETLRPGPDCLAVEQIGRYADGALTAAERTAAAAHIESCLTCASELALLEAVTATPARAGEREAVDAAVAELRRREARATRPQTRERLQVGFAIPFAYLRYAMSLAAVLLIAAGGYYLLNPPSPQLPTSVTSGNEVTRSLAVAVRGPVGDQTEVPDRLEWQPVAGASRYRARIMEVDRHELWSTEVSGTMVTLPAEARAQIVPAKTLLWQVTALDTANRAIAESAIERFRLAR